MIVFGIAIVIVLIAFITALKLGSNDSRNDTKRSAGDAGGDGDGDGGGCE